MLELGSMESQFRRVTSVILLYNICHSGLCATGCVLRRFGRTLHMRGTVPVILTLYAHMRSFVITRSELYASLSHATILRL